MSASKRWRVLVVEDEFLIADHMALLLADLGYEAIGPVSTIKEALATIARGHLDAVLLDVNLNGVRSTPIAVELKARGVPFIVVTGYGSLDVAEPLLDAAPRVTKPCDTADLERGLDSLLAR